MGDRQILFQVNTGKHEYLICTDGSIEGFGDSIHRRPSRRLCRYSSRSVQE